MADPQAITLYELNNRIKTGLKDLFPVAYWVIGEISELNINQSGHCYLELIEKNSENDKITARAKATIWAYTFRMLRPYFESITKQQLAVGLKIMVQVSVEFHELFGYSLNIKDIEPTYTVGDLSRKKEEIIARLMNEGVFHLNQELDLPIVPQRIAVISSETAAGYGDFTDQLKHNPYGYAFQITLFNAYMQGEEAEESIIQALERIFSEIERFDVVVIIRGGGSQSDLSCFNSYWLCYHVTQFPLPVITGIGHERDETIIDLVAHSHLKTPTAVAEFILGQVVSFDQYLHDLGSLIMDRSEDMISAWKTQHELIAQRIISVLRLRMNTENHRLASFNTLGIRLLKIFFQGHRNRLETIKTQINRGLIYASNRESQRINQFQKQIRILPRMVIRKETAQLDYLQKETELLSPDAILKRGYTITFCEGRLIKSVSQLKPGDTIESIWIDGKTSSTVQSVNQIRLNE